MLDFKKMTKKSDFQYERDTVKMFLHFLATKGLCIAEVSESENGPELFKSSDDKLIEIQEDFIHVCVKR